MSEEAPAMEGWAMPARYVLGTFLGIIVVMAVVLTIGAHRYRATVEPTRHRPVHVFPAPGLDGFNDPARSTPVPPSQHSPLGNAALNRAAAQGNALLQDGPKK